MVQNNPISIACGGRSTRQPLVGDPARQAIDSLLGYDYQIWRTVEAWLRLEAGQVLYIECAEDYDVVASTDADADAVVTQVKNSPANITLNSQDVRDAVANYWSLRQRNLGRQRISMRFLTRGAIGKERMSKLGAENGLELWRRAAAGDAASGRLVADHLISQGGKDDFVKFLSQSAPEELRDKLFAGIEWAAEEPSLEAVKLSVSRLAVNTGNRQGTPPSVSSRAVPALLERCRRAAVEREPELRSLTVEDAQLCFESSTSLAIPITSQLVMALGAMAGGSALTFSAARFDGEVPELPFDGLPREKFVDELLLLARGHGCVLIVGSEGEGKTTAANMVARALGGVSFWMDLRGGDEPIAVAAIENALVLARSVRPPASIVLDDLPVAQGVPEAVWGRLAVLIGAARRANVILTMTSKGVPVDLVDPRFRAFGVPVAAVPRMSEPEIVEFFLNLGCPSEKSAQVWAQVTLAHSGSGHPKLVHLAGLELRDRSWRVVEPEAFLSPPRSIEDARAHARQTACKAIPLPDRDLLFALSLGTGAFERSIAIDIGARLGLTEPGAAFDRLAGRWLERRGEAGYKATPLLNGQAKELWPPERLRETHALILDAHIARKSLRVDQATDLFLHAFQSQDARRFASFVSGLISMVDETPGLAEALELLVVVGESEEVPAISFGEHSSLLFRLLQFRIARSRRPDAVIGIARRWLLEIDRAKDQQFAAAMRAMRGVVVASAAECVLPPSVIAHAVRDAAGIEDLGIDLGRASALELGVDDSEPSRALDGLQLLFLVAQSSFESPSTMSEMLVEIEQFEVTLRARLLGSFNSPLAREGFSMFDRVLVGMSRLGESADWSAFAVGLRRAIDLGKTWDAPGFVAAAARVLSMVFDEHLGDSAAASDALSAAATMGLLPVLQDQMANLAFRGNDDAKALALWECCLWGGADSDSSGVRDPFSMRRAAIAASRLGRMRRAAEWFDLAATITAERVKVFPATSFRVDACYCWLKAGDGSRALRGAALALEEVRHLEEPSGGPRAFASQKLLGQVLLWLWHHLDARDGADEPIVGMASNPDLDIGALAALPATPPDVLDMILFETASLLRVEQPWLVECARRLAASKHPFVAMHFRATNLRSLFLSGGHSAIGEEVYHLNEALLRMHTMRLRNVTKLTEFEEEPDDSLRSRESEVAMHCLLQGLALARMRGADLGQVVEAWRVSLSSLKHGGTLIAMVNKVAFVFMEDVPDAMDLVRNSPSSAARIGAAARVLAQEGRGALDTAQAQWVLCYKLLGAPSRSVVRPSLGALCQLFANQWRRLIANPALLAQPRMSLPRLSAAVASRSPPSQMLLQLSEAAEAAAGTPIPGAILTVLREVAADERLRDERCSSFNSSPVAPD